MHHLRLLLPLCLVPLGLVAAPAQATLLVKSDSTGLLIQDKNGIGDRVLITSGTQGGNPVYVITNQNAFDVFKFDRQANCSAGASEDKSVCKRMSGKLNLGMAGGDDEVRASTSGATSASVNLSAGNDLYEGVSGPDNVFAGTGDSVIRTGPGADDITIGRGRSDVLAGAGDDHVDTDLANNDTAEDDIDVGDGDDHIALGSPLIEARIEARGGDVNDAIETSAGDYFAVGGTGADKLSNGGGEDATDVKEPATFRALRDAAACGFQHDSVTADSMDSVDSITNPGGGTCEEVDRSLVREGPHVKLPEGSLRVARNGRVAV